MLSGAHMTLAPLVVEALRSRGSDIPVVLGGIVPPRDLDELRELGVAAVFTPGASAEDIVSTITAVASLPS
jgi:methylmalonyl-CoA mutase C-terminal domain/subunit